MEYFILAFKNIFNFQGRAKRAEFIWFLFIQSLIILAIGISLFIIGLLTFYAGLPINHIIIAPFVLTFYSLLFLALILYSSTSLLAMISISVRRLHDIGLSGWWQGLVFLLIYGYTIIHMIYLAINKNNDLSKAFFRYRIGEDIYAISYSTLYINLTILILFTLFLLFKSGQPSTNKYG